jgi:aryl-alcohol dehydrogenase-like predicted oxidoreductase
MEERTLGRSGLRVSLVGLGCNNFGGRIDLEASRAVIHRALDLGITLFDTADIYGERGGSETILGTVLGERRKDIVLATKFGAPMAEGRSAGASRRYIATAVEASLKRLKTDWIDLYQLHRPDPLTPIDETLRALDDLVRAGKVRYVGVSNLPAWQLADAAWHASSGGFAAPISAQDEYSLLERGVERELLPAIHRFGLGLLPYFPLASGLLSGKYRQGAPLPEGTRFTKSSPLAERYLTEENWQRVGRLTGFAAARDRSLLELAFGWLVANQQVASVIAGATWPEQVEQNVRAVDWKLTTEDLAEIERLLESA